MSVDISTVAQAATLYIVATPIGNLGDLGQRARGILESVCVIACEDTRRSRVLFNHYNISTPLMSLHEHNEEVRIREILEKLQAGESVALVCDAGTPLISDPGYHLVKDIKAAGFTVSPIPGPSALVAGLCASGLATDSFIFDGFLPVKSQARKERLQSLLSGPRTVIIYEAPQRVIKTLEDIIAIAGSGRRLTLAREITKLYETIINTTAGELLDLVQVDVNQQKGEFVLMIAGADKQNKTEISDDLSVWLTHLAGEMPDSKLARLASKASGVSRQLIYDYILQLKSKS